MGYFKRRVDRRRSAKATRAAERRALEAAEADEGREGGLDVWTIWEGPPLVRERRWPFLRFSIRERDDESHRQTGIFLAAGDLEDREERCEGREEIREELDWFNENLPVPRLDEPAAIFFFKADAVECTDRVWHLVRLIRDNGFEVVVQRHDRPGRIVYEDEYQIAVVPFASADLR